MEIISYFRTFPFSSVSSIICKIIIFTPPAPLVPSISLIEEIAGESSSHVILPAEHVVGQQMANCLPGNVGFIRSDHSTHSTRSEDWTAPGKEMY